MIFIFILIIDWLIFGQMTLTGLMVMIFARQGNRKSCLVSFVILNSSLSLFCLCLCLCLVNCIYVQTVTKGVVYKWFSLNISPLLLFCKSDAATFVFVNTEDWHIEKHSESALGRVVFGKQRNFLLAKVLAKWKGTSQNFESGRKYVKRCCWKLGEMF